MRIVTGGAGFIGSNLVKALEAEGFDVVVVDNFHTGSPENLEGCRATVINDLSGNIHRHWDILKDAEAIFHLGIPSSSPMYKRNPWLAGKAIEEFVSILEFSRKTDSRLVFASTSSLYNGLEPPHREDMQIRVSDFYTEARLAMERLAELYNSLYGLDSVGLRYFSVYGPGERAKKTYANIVTQFLWDISSGKRPVIYGDGTQTRDFVFVSDVVRANMLAAEFRGFGIFNVGTGKSHTFNDVVSMINEMLGTDIEPVYVDNPIKNYVKHVLADTSLAEEKLGFRAEVPLNEGMRIIARHYGALE